MSINKKTIMSCPFCGVVPDPYLVPKDGVAEYAVVACKNTQCHVKPKVGSVMPEGEAIKSAVRRWNARIN